MNKLLASAIVSAAALLSAGVQAQEATVEPAPAVSQKTRAQVLAELAQARADGSIKAVSAGYIEPAKSVRTRAEVLAEVRNAKANGEYAALNAESVDPVAVQQLLARNQAATQLAGTAASGSVVR